MGTFGTPSSYSNTGALGSATNPNTAQGLSRDRENQKAILELPGTQAWVEKTITDGVIIPTSAEIIVLPEGGASTDSLTTIALTSDGTTTLHEGMPIRLKAANSNTITVVHGTGTNNISTIDGNNVVLDTTWYLELKLINGLWVQQETSAYKTANEAKTSAVVAQNSANAAQADATAAKTIPKRNRLCNGCMRIDQEHSGSTVTPAASAYVCDNLYMSITQASKLTAQRVSASLAGAPYSEKFTVVSAFSAGANDCFSAQSYVEGLDFADLLWGTAAAKPITVSFLVKVSVAGTYSFVIKNAAGTYSYVFTKALTAGEQYITQTIPGCTSGAWPIDTSKSLVLSFDLGSGSSKRTATTGAWVSGDYYGANGSVSFVATSAAAYEIGQIQLEAGSFATPFEVIPHQQALAWCQRYYEAGRLVYSGYVTIGCNPLTNVQYKNVKRVLPTMEFTNLSVGNVYATPVQNESDISSFSVYHAASATSGCHYFDSWIADARM